MITKEDIEEIFEGLKQNLTLDGKKRVFENAEKLSPKYMKEEVDPEAFTKEFLIEPIIKKLNLEKLSEKHFRGIKDDLRKVDYRVKNVKGESFLIEAKAINSNLFEESSDGAVNQIKGLFRLAEVKDNYQFGVATDGIIWVFIDKTSIEVYKLDLAKDFIQIKEILTGKEIVSSEKIEEDISKKFYDWYNSLLHGGKYKDHEGNLKTISSKDCLVENILFVNKIEEKEKII